MTQNVIWIDFNRIKIFVSEDINIRGIQLKGNNIWDDSITIKSDLLTTPTIERKKDNIIYIGNLNENSMNITKNEMTVICEFNNTSLTEIINSINETIVVDINGNDITNNFAFNTYIEPLGNHYHLINKSKDGNGVLIDTVTGGNISIFNSKYEKTINDSLNIGDILNIFLLLKKSRDGNNNIINTVTGGNISIFNSKYEKLL